VLDSISNSKNSFFFKISLQFCLDHLLGSFLFLVNFVSNSFTIFSFSHIDLLPLSLPDSSSTSSYFFFFHSIPHGPQFASSFSIPNSSWTSSCFLSLPNSFRLFLDLNLLPLSLCMIPPKHQAPLSKLERFLNLQPPSLTWRAS